jgi:hypothetical protein
MHFRLLDDERDGPELDDAVYDRCLDIPSQGWRGGRLNMRRCRSADSVPGM